MLISVISWKYHTLHPQRPAVDVVRAYMSGDPNSVFLTVLWKQLYPATNSTYKFSALEGWGADEKRYWRYGRKDLGQNLREDQVKFSNAGCSVNKNTTQNSASTKADRVAITERMKSNKFILFKTKFIRASIYQTIPLKAFISRSNSFHN